MPLSTRAAATFARQRVVLTGASSGIGEAMALELAAVGARLALASRTVGELEAVAERCRGLGAETLAFPTDVADESACTALVDGARQAFGGLDTLIANAGITMWARFEELESLEPARRLMEINYFGTLACIRAALPELLASRGRIVAVASLTGKTGVPSRSCYGASKHAVVGFCDALRIEVADRGLSVTVACPDFVATRTRERALGANGRSIGHSPVQEGRIMDAETCARLILEGAARRKRELVLSARGRVGLVLKIFAPGLVDRIAARAIRRGR